MPSYLYILLPILAALAVCGLSAWWLRGEEQDGEGRFVAVSIALSASMYFATTFALLAFIPGPGSFGPVQYAAGHAGARALFSYRIQLVWIVLIGGPIVALWDLGAFVVAARTKSSKLQAAAFLACLLLMLAGVIAFAKPGWFPMV